MSGIVGIVVGIGIAGVILYWLLGNSSAPTAPNRGESPRADDAHDAALAEARNRLHSIKNLQTKLESEVKNDPASVAKTMRSVIKK